MDLQLVNHRSRKFQQDQLVSDLGYCSVLKVTKLELLILMRERSKALSKPAALAMPSQRDEWMVRAVFLEGHQVRSVNELTFITAQDR